MNTSPRKVVLPAAIAAAALVLPACSTSPEPAPVETTTETTVAADGGVEKQTPSSTATSSAPAGVRTVDYSQLQQVSRQTFTSGDFVSFRHVNGTTTGECFVNEVVMCTGSADGSVPDVDMPPFSGRPGAIQIGPAGLAYAILEGVPPAQNELKPGQWVDFGVAKCAKPDDESLVCSNDTAAFEVAGEKRRIVTEGPVLTYQELAEQTKAEPTTEYRTGTDVLVQGPIMCGAMEGHRLAEVIEGEITCAEAMDVLDRYDAKKQAEGGGNTLAVSFDGWNCSSPTYGRATELRASTVCNHPGRGIEVRAPWTGGAQP